MLSCIFEQCLDGNTFILTDENTQYKVKLVFLNLEKPKQGDKILINEMLLKEATSRSVREYFFKLDKSMSPRIAKEANLKDFIVVKIAKKIYTLKRMYG